VSHQLKVFMIEQMFDVVLGTGEEIIKQRTSPSPARRRSQRCDPKKPDLQSPKYAASDALKDSRRILPHHVSPARLPR
jgi:hypothetical protein